jgi:signal transduction histidine kinase
MHMQKISSGELLKRKSAKHFRNLSHSLLDTANRNLSPYQFLKGVTAELLIFSECDSVELRLIYSDHILKCESQQSGSPFHFEISSSSVEKKNCGSDNPAPTASGFDLLLNDILNNSTDKSQPYFTISGSFWSGDTQNPFLFRRRDDDTGKKYDMRDLKDYRSLLAIPLSSAGKRNGILCFKSVRQYYFTQEEIVVYEDVAQFLTIALDNQEAQYNLKERVKELSCLYGLAKLAQIPNTSVDELLQGVASLLPPAFQYPNIAAGRITMDGFLYSTQNFREDGHILSADIILGNDKRGEVAVSYPEEKTTSIEGLFLREETELLNTVASQIASIVEQREAREEKVKLQDQLRHADRLATIGQLAAGVAHEVNEPLSTILGFAQLMKRNAGMPKQSAKDNERIIKAALHAREVVRKLVTFAKQKPPKIELANLNTIVQDGLSFLQSRLRKSDIELIQLFQEDLPEIMIDPSQMYQVIVNLVVNALQAMPNGGRITISTVKVDDFVSLIVEDTGIGMSEEVLQKLFIPFFTTKDVGEGTGLGLAVVHGIVTSHNGSINVASKTGKGSRFEVKLPLPGRS